MTAPSREPFHIIPMTADLAAARMDDLLAMERDTAREQGTVYADDVWAAEHFLKELPGKWRYSQLALGEDGHCVGFLVASLPGSPQVGVYTHRAVVDARLRGQGVYRRLWDTTVRLAQADGVSTLSLSISTENERLLSFYDREGAVRLRGSELREFARERGFRAEVLEDRLVEDTGHQKFLYVCRVELG